MHMCIRVHMCMYLFTYTSNDLPQFTLVIQDFQIFVMVTKFFVHYIDGAKD